MSKYKKLYETDNLYYTNLNYDLIPDYLTMVNDPNVQKFISKQGRTFTYEEEVEWIKGRLEAGNPIFSIIEKSTDEFVGNIEYLNHDIGYEIGISLTPNKQDRHYGTEAINFMIDYGHNVMGIDDVRLSVFSHNDRAIHCYNKIGFVEERREKNAFVINGQSVDDIGMILKR